MCRKGYMCVGDRSDAGRIYVCEGVEDRLGARLDAVRVSVCV